MCHQRRVACAEGDAPGLRGGWVGHRGWVGGVCLCSRACVRAACSALSLASASAGVFVQVGQAPALQQMSPRSVLSRAPAALGRAFCWGHLSLDEIQLELEEPPGRAGHRILPVMGESTTGRDGQPAAGRRQTRTAVATARSGVALETCS
jgi:hypothetical protein